MKRCLFARMIVLALAFCLFFSFSGISLAADKPYKIVISSLWPASSVYGKAVLWAKQINANSKIVEAVAQEGKGPNVAMKTLVKYPKMRKTFIYFGTETDWWTSQQGYPGWKEFTKKYDFNNFKHLAINGFTADVVLTAKPDIKRAADMDGKSFIASSRTLNSAHGVAFVETFKQIGVKPKIKALATRAMLESCRDGLVDVIYGGYSLLGPNQYVAAPYLNELLATKKIYPVDLGLEPLLKMKKATGHPVSIVKFAPGSINANQDYPVYTIAKALTWMCDVSVPDEVVTEILNIYYDHIDEIKDVHPSGKIITKESMAAIGVPESRFHPAAVRFYKQKGVAMTSLKELKLIE